MKECSHPMPDRVTVDDLGVTSVTAPSNGLPGVI
jgi:hypothetical protein